MTRILSTTVFTTATGFFLATTAMADVSSRQVLDDMKAYMALTGNALSVASEEQNGNVLTLRGVVVSQDFGGNGQGSFTLDYGTVTLTENNDGTVLIGLDGDIQYEMTTMPASDDFAFVLDAAVPGYSIVASGDDTTTRYDFVAPEFSATIAQLMIEGHDIDANLDLTGSGYSGSFSFTKGDLMKMEGRGSLDAFGFDFGMNVPDESLVVNANLAMNGSEFSFSGSVPSDMDFTTFDSDPAAIPALFSNGAAIDVDYTLGATTFDLNAEEGRNRFAANGAWADAGIQFIFNASRFLFAETANDVNVTVSGSDIPFPELSLEMGTYGLHIDMPLAKSDAASDASVEVRLVDVSVSDFLWGMIDPTGQLPRDPATLVVDLSGKVNALVDIFNPMEAAMHAGPPAELHEATLNDLQLQIAGVDLSGSGAFTFDNSDLTSFDGLPRPEGALDLVLNGANTLLDKLVAMGLVPEDQAMGGRMMMGLFAVPGAGEDSLNSRIEVNSEGHVLANGQRLR